MIEEVKNYRQRKEMAENLPDAKARERFRRPAYCAKSFAKEAEQEEKREKKQQQEQKRETEQDQKQEPGRQQEQQLEHKTVEQYLSEKYNITQRREF